MSQAALQTAVRVRELPEGSSLREFIDLTWQANQQDPLWVPPLRSSLENALNRRKHPFHQHADVAYFLAEREGKVVGRIAAIVNHLHNQFHADKTGFFGLFECRENEPEAARVLVETAAEWLRQRGMERIRGPVNFSTNEEISSPGVLVEGFDTPPVALMSHNPPYYAEYLEGAGLEKAKDLLAFWMDNLTPPERLERAMKRITGRSGIEIRSLDMKRFREEVDVIKEIYNAAWAQNWGFVPMTDAEFEHMAKEFRPVVDPELCLIAEQDGEPIGFSLALPDLNQALRHLPDGRLFPWGLFKFLWHKRKIHGLRLITLGFKPGFQHLGLGAAFYLRTWKVGVQRGYDQGEGSWVLEDNLDMVHTLERMGARAYKRYRIFERPLSAS